MFHRLSKRHALTWVLVNRQRLTKQVNDLKSSHGQRKSLVTARRLTDQACGRTLPSGLAIARLLTLKVNRWWFITEQMFLSRLIHLLLALLATQELEFILQLLQKVHLNFLEQKTDLKLFQHLYRLKIHLLEMKKHTLLILQTL